MEANELRIGNWVKEVEIREEFNDGTWTKISADLVKVENIWREGINVVASPAMDFSTLIPAPANIQVTLYSKIEGIRLTVDQLVKFGFKKRQSIGFDYYELLIPVTGCRTIQRSRGFTVNENCTVAFINGEYLTDIEFVHQLQNLYFALTGEELKIKQ